MQHMYLTDVKDIPEFIIYPKSLFSSFDGSFLTKLTMTYPFNIELFGIFASRNIYDRVDRMSCERLGENKMK